jgi:uncharacterized protein (TIGR03792 family)
VVIELLKVEVAAEHQEKYLQLDREIWTKAIAQFPGFISKEVWLNPHAPTEVILIIRWRSREEWKAISVKLLEEVERQFVVKMGNIRHKIVESTEYQVVIATEFETK